MAVGAISWLWRWWLPRRSVEINAAYVQVPPGRNRRDKRFSSTLQEHSLLCIRLEPEVPAGAGGVRRKQPCVPAPSPSRRTQGVQAGVSLGLEGGCVPRPQGVAWGAGQRQAGTWQSGPAAAVAPSKDKTQSTPVDHAQEERCTFPCSRDVHPVRPVPATRPAPTKPEVSVVCGALSDHEGVKLEINNREQLYRRGDQTAGC